MDVHQIRVPAPVSAAAISVAAGDKLVKLPTRCINCSLQELCLPCGLNHSEPGESYDLVYARRFVNRGDSVFRAGDEFKSVYAIRTGFFKTVMFAADGREQVTGFSMSGELLGLDGIAQDVHNSDAVALEDSEVCVIPYARIEDLGHDNMRIQHQFHRAMSREIVRDNGMLALLGAMGVKERFAVFLLNLSQRLTARGYSPSDFALRMSRHDIGSYLGTTLETVSRMFSRYADEGVISVHRKHIRIIDITALRNHVNPTTH